MNVNVNKLLYIVIMIHLNYRSKKKQIIITLYNN
jgi:hypothetical protein